MSGPIKVTEDQLQVIDSAEVLKLNDNVYLRKEKCFDILQKWSDKVEAETVVPLQSRIAELESRLSAANTYLEVQQMNIKF